MAEQKAKLSKLCLTGFILSVIVPFAMALCFWLIRKSNNDFYWIILGLVICLPFIGMILSTVGLATARNKGRKGKGFGIAGIVLPNVYTATVVILVVAFFFKLGSANIERSEREKNSDLYGFGGAGTPVYTEYDVDRYRLTRDFDLDSPDAFASEAELSAYARDKLAAVNDINSIRAKGTYLKYNFIIVRIDQFKQWASDDPLASFYYSKDGYAVVSYEENWEFSAFRTNTLEVFKDPSDKFIIITNCNDYSVITDFF